MRPRTLLELAGVTPAPSRLANAAVVVIDAQREYVTGKLPLASVGPALSEIGSLLARARAAGTSVIHIQHRGRPGGAFGPDTPGYPVDDAARPQPGRRPASR